MMHAALLLPLSWFVDRFAHQFADLSRISSTALVAAIWQGTLLALAAALALRLLPRISAAARFAVWFAVFALIAALPFLSLAPHSETHALTTGPDAAWFHLDSRWTIAIAVIWAAASITRASTLIAAALRVRTLSRRATPTDTPSLDNHAASRRAQVCSSSDVDRPTVIGFFAAKILIPSWLLEKLTPAELEQVVLHEAGHLSRADDWLNLLQKIALVLFPLNPALAWVERRLCFERELACDERVLTTLAARTDEPDGAATGYASCLATLAEYRLQRRGLVTNLALALGALGTSARESELARRVARILRPVARMKPLHARLAVGGAVVTLLFAATELQRCPQVISFTSPAQTSQLASLSTVPSPATATLPGYRALTTRATLPAEQQWKPAGAAVPHLAESRPDVARASVSTPAHALNVSASQSRARAAVSHLIDAHSPESYDSLFITHWSVVQSSGNLRAVRTTAALSAPLTVQTGLRNDTDPPPPSTAPPAPQAQQILQAIPSYAAVPIPGGWLVFQL